MANKKTTKPSEPIERAFIIRKISLSEWQRIDLKIQGDKVIERIEREPNMSAIVARNVSYDLARDHDD